MNRSYRIVWSKARGAFMVAAETAVTHSSSGSTTLRAVRRAGQMLASGIRSAWAALRAGLVRQELRAWAALTAGALYSAIAWAAPPAPAQLPTGAQVASGQANVSIVGNQMTVQQTTDKAILNWQSFNIGSSASVRFNQPSSSSVALNRVQSTDPTHIFGQLTANGQVILLNPNGVLFGPTARIDVGALVAGAMKISDADFLAGKYKFTDGQGSVVNQGQLDARESGLIALLAPEVRNEGVIRARQGTVILAAGEAMTLHNSASGWGVVVDKGAYNALVENRQLVSAEDGTVFMSARAASALQQAVIRNSGNIEAKGAVRVGGKIRLAADVVRNSGSIDASAPATGQGSSQGGNIQIAASEYSNTGTIRANGDQGGSIAIAAAQILRNEGRIEALGSSGAGGQVSLVSGGQLVQTPSASVSVRSEGVAGQGGSMGLRAAQIDLQGQLDAASAQGTGGSVRVVAAQATFSGAQLDASGDAQGGHIDLSGPQVGETLANAVGSAASDAVPEVGSEMPWPLPEAPLAPHQAILTGSSLNASSRRGRGGSITLTSDDIRLSDHTRVDVTGATRGGMALIGGDWQGGKDLSLRAADVAIHQATQTGIDSSVVIDASATENGDGGTIVAWSDITRTNSLTTVNGQLLARGGAQGGNGGRIETSGYLLNTDTIRVSTQAPKGNTGEWLIDPYDITISNATAAGVSNTSGTFTPSANSAIVNSTALQNALSSSNVTVTTGTSGAQAGNITVADALTNSTANSLTLKAQNNIVINADLMSSGTGALILRAGSGSVSGTGTIVMGSASNTASANLQLAHGTTMANNIRLDGKTTIGFASLEVEYLIVAGGGGGGYARGGGGGAGGFLSGNEFLAGSPYTVTVGTGGAALSKGGNSSFIGTGISLTAIGGGSGSGGSPMDGGSGGGASAYASALAGTGTLGQGFAGGLGSTGGTSATTYQYAAAGGGGGAGGVGQAGNGITKIGGAGGIGKQSDITGSSVWYAGGGGGFSDLAGGSATVLGGAGGLGGGGKGGDADSAGQNADANTGGGGGGTYTASQGAGAGGSGIVVLRYRGNTAASGGTIATNPGAASGYTVHRFTVAETSNFTVENLSATVSGSINGAGALIANAARGTITISGSNTFSGGTTVSAGTLKTTSTTALGSGMVALSDTAGAVLNVAGSLSIGSLSGGGITGGDVVLGGGFTLSTGALNSSTVYAGEISGAGHIEKVGAGNFTLTGTNTYSGTTTINDGTLRVGNSGTVGTLGSGAVVINASLSINRANALSIGNTISGTGSLTQAGSGNLTLTGTNNYSGGTNLDAGTLTVRSNSALGMGVLTMAGGTTLLLEHGSNFTNTINLNGAANIGFAPLEVEYLIVGGGGGGGYARGGGGGAGGFLSGAASLAGLAYTVTVGAGGAALNMGGDSSFIGSGVSKTAIGGGSGGGGSPTNGGSGGGATAYAGATAGTGAAGQGNTGGLGTGNDRAAGGGGGAGGVGQAGNTTTQIGGAGGIGRSSDISGSTVWYAGGGGGFSNLSGGAATVNGGDGGQGGGGKGGDLDSRGQDGAANTGGGGGGTYTVTQGAGSGGSGIVVLRYRGPAAASGGSPTAGANTATGYTVHQFTATGNDNFTINNLSASISGTISGAGALMTNATGGTITISGNNTFSGGTTVSSGTLKTLSSASALGTGLVSFANTAGAILNVASNLTIGNLSGGGTTGGEVQIAAGATLSTGALDTAANFTGVISGLGTLEKIGTGTFTLTGSNTLSGTTCISAGTLQVGNNGATGTLGSGQVINNATLVIDRSNDLTIGNAFSGTGTLIKKRSNNLTLSGNSSFTGGTTVETGSLTVRSSTALGTGVLNMAGSTTLLLGHEVTLGNSITLNGSTTIGFAPLEVEYLIVGGGGGGGGDNGGGGGGGGFLTGTSYVAPGNTASVSVGIGGSGGTVNVKGTSGGSSSFNGITASGGGGGSGGGGATEKAQIGGSGGGGDGENNLTGADGITGQGFRGGDGFGGDAGGGGGGGAGGPGSKGTSTAGGAGGIGAISDITGTATYYAGGGGGGAANSSSSTSMGGQGGGGAGGSGTATAGTNGLGGGGGGAGWNGSIGTGAAGGSGVVVVRYRGAAAAAGGTDNAGTGTATGYTVHRFTATGSGNFAADKLVASLSGTITGSGALTTNATGGVLTLSGASTFMGGTTVSAGTLKTVTSNSALGSGTVSLNNNAGAILNVASNLTIGNLSGGGTNGGHVQIASGATLSTGALNTAASFAGVISGAGALEKIGASTFTLTGTNTYSGTTTINAGTLQIGNNGTTGMLGTGQVVNNGALLLDRSDDLSMSHLMSGSGTLTKRRSNNLTLRGASSYSGGTSLEAGTLTLRHSTAIGTGALTMAGGSTLLVGHDTAVANAISLSGAATIGLAPVEILVEYLLVGGGGAGGYGKNNNPGGGGGGGGGGVLSNSALVTGSNTVTVGSGGTSAGAQGGNGGNTSAFGVTALGGGGGAGEFSGWPAGSGSSGGGGGGNGGARGTGTTGQGFDGGLSGGQAGGGGGGAGSVGGNAVNGTTPGVGGAGISSSITGTSITYGTGGAGGAANGGTSGTAGGANTGRGGGGASGNSGGSSGFAGAGGSGIVVVRYLSSTSLASGGTVTAGSGSAAGYQIHTFNSSGTFAIDSGKATASLTGVISGANALVITPNGGTLTLANNSTYTGSTTLNAGTVRVGTGATAGSLGTGAIINNAALQYNRSDIWSVANSIGGTGSLTKQGSGTLVLTGANNYTGATTISAGTLQIGDGGSAGTLGSGAVTNDSALVFSRSNAYELANAISGSGSLTVNGGGTITLTTNASYTGSTLIDTASTLVLKNNAPTKGSSSFGGAGTLVIEPSGTSFTNTFNTSGWSFGSTLGGLRLGKSGNTAGITLTSSTAMSIAGGLTVYGGATAVNQSFASTGSGNLFFEVDSLSFGASGQLGSAGQLQIQPRTLSSTIGLGGATGTFALPAEVFSSKLADGFTGITIGHQHNTGKITVGAIAPQDPLTLHNTVGGIELTGLLNASSNTVVLDTTGTVTDTGSGAITTGSLAIKNASSAVLDTASNNVGTLAGSVAGGLTLVNAGTLTVGAVNPTGISAGGAIRLISAGDLLVNESLSTTDTSANAVVLVAGSAQAAGTSNGGDVKIAQGKTIGFGAGGTGRIYTGSLSGSTGVVDAIASGHFRYNSIEGGHNFSKAIGTGLYAIYREQPSVNAVVNSQTITYGEFPTISGTTTGLLNGDTATYAVDAPVYSASSNLTAGSYTLVSSLGSQLGYAVTGSTGALTVNQKPLTLTGTLANDKVYDGTTSATLSAVGTLSGAVGGDTVSVNSGYTAGFDNRNVGPGKTVSVSGLSLTGTDAGNYSLAATATTTASITPLSVTVTAAARSKTYGDADPALTYSITSGSLATGDTSFSGSLSRVSGEGAGTRSITRGTLAVDDGSSGNNYTLTFVGNNLTINSRAITLAASTTSGDNTKVYGSTDPALVVSVTSGSLVTGDTLSELTGTVSRRSGENVGTYDVLLGSGTKANNYSITFNSSNAAFSITPRPLSLTGSATGVTKTYDGTTAMPAGVTGYSVGAYDGTLHSGLVNGDDVQISGAPVFASKDAGTRSITQGSLALRGASAGNYTLSWTNGSGVINPAPLTMRANDDARLVVQSDTVGYAGVSYAGFVNGESASDLTGTATVTRSSTGPDGNTAAANTTAGSYTNALTPSGVSATNYTITPVAGNYTIVPAGQLLVKVSPATSTYGSDPAYSLTAQYLQADNTTVLTFTKDATTGARYTLTGHALSLNDGVGGTPTTATLNLVPQSPLNSASGNLSVSAYQLGAGSPQISGTNFTTLKVVGSLSVTPKTLTWTPIAPASKTYDGTTAIANPGVTLTGVLSSSATPAVQDVVQPAVASASFTGRHVGTTAYTFSGVGLSGADAGNYVLSSSSGSFSDGTITARPLTVTANALSKVYGNADPVLTYTTTGLVSGDTLSMNLARAAGETVSSSPYAVTQTGYSISDGHSTPGSNYTLSFNNGSLAITPRPITVQAQDQRRAYGDANPASGAVLLTGGSLAFSDALGTATLTTAATATSSAGTSAALAPSTQTFTTGASSNYSITYANGTLTIDPRAITVTASNQSREYGASNPTSGSVSVTSGSLVNGDTISTATVSASTATASSSAGSSHVLMPSGAVFSQGTSSNYSITYNGGLLSITPRAVNLAGSTGVTRSYNGNTAIGVDGVTGYGSLVGLLPDDLQAVSLTGSPVFDSKDAGQRAIQIGTVALTGGAAGNYSLNWTNGSGTITPATLTIAGTKVGSKVYDGTTQVKNITVGSTINGLVVGETVNVAVFEPGSFLDSKDAGNRTATVAYSLSDGSGGGKASNYTLATSTHDAEITPKALTISGLSAANKVYDGFTVATVSGSAQLQAAIAAGSGNDSDGKPYSGDQLSLSGTAIGNFNSKNVLDASSVSFTGLTLAGAQKDNYTLTPHADNTSARITAKPLGLDVPGASKVYDGSTSIMPSGAVTLTGVVGSDDVILGAGTVTGFVDKDVGSNKPVVFSGFTLAGGDAANYALISGSASSTATITRANLVLSGERVYDGGSTFAGLYLTATGVNGESFSVTGSGDSSNLASKQVADNPTGTRLSSLTGLALGSGNSPNALASNYNALSVQDSSVSLTPRTLTVTFTGVDKIYDADIAATVSTSDDRVVGDSFTIGRTAAFDAKDVGSRPVNISGISLTGTDAGNYLVASTASTVANITAAPLTITGVTVSDKVYDGNAVAVLGGTASVTPLLSDDVSVSGTGTGTFTDKNVANAKPVTVTGYTLTGADAANYSVVQPAGLTASITRLNSATWVGGASGDWFNPANWAVTGNLSQTGVIPDLANVANVVIPAGSTVNFSTTGVSPAVANSPVQIDSLGSAGGLSQSGGTLGVGAGGVSLGSFIQTGGDTTVAGDFAVTTAFSQSGAGALQVGGSTSISATSSPVQLGYLQSSGALTVSSAGGAITQATGTTLTLDSTASFTASDGLSPATRYDITLNNSGNNFAGAVSSDGANVALKDGTGGLILDKTVATGTLDVTSTGGAITQKTPNASTNAISVTGAASFTASNGATPETRHNITLDNPDNDFGTVGLTGSVTQIQDSNALTVVLNTTGDTTVIAGGALAVSGSVTGAASNLTTSTTTVGVGMTFGTTTVGGSFITATNNGNISQTGSLTINGMTSLNAGSGDITLLNADNDFTGDVSASGGVVKINDQNALKLVTVTATGDLTLASAGPLDLGTTTVSGKLQASSGNGDITQNGLLKVSGTSDFKSGTGDILLTGANDFAGLVSSSGANIALNDEAGGLQLGATQATGTLDVTSSRGPIVQASPYTEESLIKVRGAASFTARDGATPETSHDITLTHAFNDFAGLVVLKGRNLQVQDRNDLKLEMDATGDLSAEVGGALALQGSARNMRLDSLGDTQFGPTRVGVNLTSQSSAGSILQVGPLEVLGKTVMRAAAKIELPNTRNNLVSGVESFAPSVLVTGDKMAEAAAAAAAAAAAVVPVAPANQTLGTSQSQLLSMPVLAPVLLQSQGAVLKIASGVSSSPSPEASAQGQSGLQLVLSPVTSNAASVASTAPSALSDSGFVEVRSFEPLKVPAVASFSFTLPADTFVHKDAQMRVRVEAQTPDGGKLPPWLTFSPSDMRFTGIAPEGVTRLEVVVKAVDADGVEVLTTITLDFSGT